MERQDWQGLTHEEAQRRLAQDGPNSLPARQRRWPALLLQTLREPMFLLLFGAAALYLLLGDWLEGGVLLVMVLLTIGLTLLQQARTERALHALRDLSAPRALVIRSGALQRIAGTELVRGDLLVLNEGDRVAADAVLLEANGLCVEESMLTGEACAVGKRAAAMAPPASGPGGADTPFVWSGTLVVQGDGLARVTATAADTELGKIGLSLQSLGVQLSPLQRQAGRLTRLMAVVGLALSLLVCALYGLQSGDWLAALLTGIALTMSLLPEEFPVIMTVFPAIGAWRLARAQVLTRNLASVEALGAISVLCADKTGTLTENRMRVAQLYAAGNWLAAAAPAPLAPPFAALARTAALASKPRPSDPMEQALHALAGPLGAQEPLRVYPLSATLRAMSQVWGEGEDGLLTVAAKGAPEAIGALCRLDAAQLDALRAAADQMAAQGLRVLGVAHAQHAAAALPAGQEGFDFRFLGLLGLADPLRAQVPDAIQQCHAAGIRVIMITGDYPATAASIARQAGLAPGDLLNGDELDALDEAALRSRLASATVCARISPLQKLRIVQALKANGEVVAMTGDGVNDAPALKAAHVGIAMGRRGTDVAREAAAQVLLDDNFASIVRGIRLGRRIFANMRSAMSYVFAIHLPIAGMALLPALLGWPAVLYPLHIAFLELIIDPACSLAFENEASDAKAMTQPPRPVDSPLLDRWTLLLALLHGALGLLAVALVYQWGLQHLSLPAARATGFAALVLVNLALIFANLGRLGARGANRLPLLVALAAGAMLALAFGLEPARQAFLFAFPGPGPLAVALAAALACYLVCAAARRSSAAWPGYARRLWLGLLALGLLAGCAGPAPERPAPPPALDLPASWYREVPAGDNRDLGAWWQRFGDSQLTALVELALQQNTSLAVAAARLQQARALRDVAAAGLASQVSTNMSAQSVRQRTLGVQNSYRAGIDASWEPDLYGYRRAGVAASVATLEAEALTLADGQVSLAAEVALTYLELRGVQLREAAASAQVRRQWLLWLAAQQANAQGALERERAHAAWALAMADLAQWAGTAAQLEHSLAVLCGSTPGALALAPQSTLPQAPGDLALSLPADTLRQRPDVRAAAARVDAALARLGQAEAARKPVLRLEGSIGLHGLGLGGSGNSVLRGLLGAISGVAFDGGAGRARVAAEQAALQQSYAEYRAAVLGALREVEDALAGLAAARNRRAILDTAAAAARRAAPLALQAYQDGAGGLDAVLASHATLLASEEALVEAGVAESASYVRLYKALGGGWQQNSPAP